MRTTVLSINYIAALIAVYFSLLFANSASALVINFDELGPVDPDPETAWFGEHPLTDQYAAQGVLIDGGAWLNGYESHNYMTIGSGGSALKFIGALPTFVSMEVESIHEDVIYFTMIDAAGSLFDKQTAGWQGPVLEYIPSIPNELISFSSELGISSINMIGFYNLRTEANIDNITITYSSVPEPSSFALLALGLLGAIWRRLLTNRY